MRHLFWIFNTNDIFDQKIMYGYRIAASAKPPARATARTAGRTILVRGSSPSRPDTGNGTAGSPLSSGRRSQSQAAVCGHECSACGSQRSAGRIRHARRQSWYGWSCVCRTRAARRGVTASSVARCRRDHGRHHRRRQGRHAACRHGAADG